MNSSILAGLAGQCAADTLVLPQTIPMFSRIPGDQVAGSFSQFSQFWPTDDMPSWRTQWCECSPHQSIHWCLSEEDIFRDLPGNTGGGFLCLMEQSFPTLPSPWTVWSFLILCQGNGSKSILYLRPALGPTFTELSQWTIRAGFMCPCQRMSPKTLLRAPGSKNPPYPDWIYRMYWSIPLKTHFQHALFFMLSW